MVIGHTNQEVCIDFCNGDFISLMMCFIGTPVRNKDNRDLPITDPTKSDFSPWTQYCAYFVAQPSKLQVN